MQRQCSAITRSGGRCQRSAEGPNGLCWIHNPENAEERRRQASRAGRSKPNREVADLKAELRDLIADVRSGKLERNDAAVMVQAYRALKDYIELERRVREVDELSAEIEELKRGYGAA